MDQFRGAMDTDARPAAAYRYGDALPASSQLLEELLTSSEIHQLFESYYKLIHIPVAIIDLNANVLFSSRWQRICAQYHRVHPETCARCIESDTSLAQQLKNGQSYTIYTCLNGLTDCASPIVIDGKHVANVFIGQFLTKAPDEARFRRQAQEFGFDETDYLAALRDVPIVAEEQIPLILELLTRMTWVITNLSVERKLAVESQIRQAVILNTIPQSVFWKDAEGRYLGCNTAFARNAGLDSPEEVVGKTDFELPWPRADAEAYRVADQTVVASNRSQLHIIESVQMADGSRAVVDTSKIPLIGAGGVPSGIVGVFQDITAQQEVEAALLASEARFRTLIDRAPVAIGLSRAGKTLYVNQKYVEMYGLQSAESVVGKPLGDLWAPESRELVMERARQRGRGLAVPASYEGIGLRPDGSTLAVHAAVEQLDLPDGPASVAFLTDVSERKRAETVLRETDARFRAAFMTGADAYVIVEMENGRIIEANDRLLELYGYTRDEVIGRTSLELGMWVDPDRRNEVVAAIQEHGWVRNMDVRARRKNGEVFPVLYSVTVLRSDGPPLYVGVIRDITQLKEAASERERLQAELLQAQRMESVGRLAGGVAHDFNNLLTVINGSAEFVLGNLPEGDPNCEDVKEILAAGRRAAGLTRQLLAFSRRQILNPQIVDINAAVAGTVKMLGRLIGEDVRLVARFATQPCLTKVDVGQIEQVLMNLAVNARDAMPKGGTLTVETRRFLPNEGFAARHPDAPHTPLVCLSVSDTGHGMTDEVKSRVFEPFFTTKELGKGTGLGLAMVFGIIKQSGGEIEIESAPGQGTTFSIYLPQVDLGMDGRKADVASELVPRGNETVLLVEDEESIRRIGERALRQNGYTVLSASHAAEALRVLEWHGLPVDLLVADVVLPGLSGRELARLLWEKGVNRRTLYVSGHTEDTIVEHGVLEPGLAFLGKPFSPNEFLHKVRAVLDGPADQARA